MWSLVILRTSTPILRDDGERPPGRWGSYASFSCNAYVQYKYTPTHSEDKLLDLSLERNGRQPGLSAPRIYDAAGHHYWNPQKEGQYWWWCNFLMHSWPVRCKEKLRFGIKRPRSMHYTVRLIKSVFAEEATWETCYFQTGGHPNAQFGLERLWARAYRQNLSMQWHSVHSWCSHTTFRMWVDKRGPLDR